MLPALYLMRHGQTVWNAEGRLHGGLDSPLTALGLRQARWQADLVAGIAGHRLTSPQGRAVQTARVVFGPGRAIPHPALAEIGIGAFAGRLLDDLRRADPGLFTGPALAWYDRCPGGEGLSGLALRCRAMLAGLDGPALIVSHGITLRMIAALALRPAAQAGATPSALDLEAVAVGQGRVCIVKAGQWHELRHPDEG